MGCWGITAFESDTGLDAVGFIRRNLPEDGKLSLAALLEALRQDDWNGMPEPEEGWSHTSPMATAEIMMKLLDGNMDGLDYEGAPAGTKKFANLQSFSASKESILWLRDYLSDTLRCQRESAAIDSQHGRPWGGWFEEKDWTDWQEHMEGMVKRLDTLLTLPGDPVELLSPEVQSQTALQEQEEMTGPDLCQ